MWSSPIIRDHAAEVFTVPSDSDQERDGDGVSGVQTRVGDWAGQCLQVVRFRWSTLTIWSNISGPATRCMMRVAPLNMNNLVTTNKSVHHTPGQAPATVRRWSTAPGNPRPRVHLSRGVSAPWRHSGVQNRWQRLLQYNDIENYLRSRKIFVSHSPTLVKSTRTVIIKIILINQL